mgnify:CR=1 FL=1
MNEEQRVPHYKTIAAVTFMVLAAFFAVTLWVLMEGDDPTIKGAVVGTWTALATTAGGFWLGSSSGGKAKP